MQVLEKGDCERRGMGLYLGVATASAPPPQFIHLTYKPREAHAKTRKIALVGKAVCFDTGVRHLHISLARHGASQCPVVTAPSEREWSLCCRWLQPEGQLRHRAHEAGAPITCFCIAPQPAQHPPGLTLARQAVLAAGTAFTRWVFKIAVHGR